MARSARLGAAVDDQKTNAFDIADCINQTCPWSGEPVQSDSLTVYNGHIVGFCNTGCRDKFDAAVHHFQEALAARVTRKHLARTPRPARVRRPAAQGMAVKPRARQRLPDHPAGGSRSATAAGRAGPNP